MTDAQQVEETVDHLTENVSEPAVNNIANNTDDTAKETLVSDVTREKFAPGFEFSVTVEPKSGEEHGSFEREITISGSDGTSSQTVVELETAMEHVANKLPSMTLQEEDESTFIVLPDVPKTEESVVSATSIQDDSSKGDLNTYQAESAGKTECEDSQPGASPTTEEKATLEAVGTLSVNETTIDEPAELTPAQHGPSAAEVIRATPEAILVMSTNESSPPKSSPTETPDITRESPVTSNQECPPSGTSTLTGSEDVASNGPIPKPEATPATLGEQTRVKKKKQLFHFKLRPLKKAKSEAHPSREGKEMVESSTAVTVAAEPSGQHKLTANVRKAFGNLRRTMSLHRKTEPRTEPSVRPTSRPIRPPPPWREDRSKEHGLKKHSSLQDFDQPSLSSVSRPSLPATPQSSKRQRLQEALPYLDKAMPSELTANEEHPEAALSSPDTENALLGQVAASIAHPRRQIVSQNSEATEERVHPIMIQRSASISDETSASGAAFSLLQSTGGPRSAPGRPGIGLPPKPPRPQSPPLLSPLDYQHFNEAPEQQDLTAQRIAMMNELDPEESRSESIPAVHTTQTAQVKRPQYQLKSEPKPISVDFSHRDDYSMDSPSTIRRAHTLRTDYASLVRERVRSLRAEPNATATTPVRPLKMRPKAENYVCTETIKLPKFNFKLKRRQTVSPKTVHSRSGNDHAMVKGQLEHTRVTSYYHPQYRRPDSPESDLHSEYVITSQMGALQCTPPVTRIHQQNGTPEMKYAQPTELIMNVHQTQAHSGLNQQPTDSIESPYRPKCQRFPGKVQKQETKSLNLPYFSEPSVSIMGTTSPSSDVTLAHFIRKSQSFLPRWDQMCSKTVGENDEQTNLEENCRQELDKYLSICNKVRMFNVQGQFAPFETPIACYDMDVWPKYGQLADWSRLLMMRKPYAEEKDCCVLLEQSYAKQEKFTYPKRPVDTLLSEWLDGQPMTVLQGKAARESETLTHPVDFAVMLNQLLESKPYKNEPRNQLLTACVSLAAVLSYADCLECLSQQPDGTKMKMDVNNALAVMSVENCLVLFHYDLAPETSIEPGEPETNPETTEQNEQHQNTLISRLVGADQTTVKQIIGDLITELRQHTVAGLKETGGLPNMIDSVEPPDWVAKVLARIMIKSK